MPYITNAQLTTALAARLKRVGVDISNSEYWPVIVNAANYRAYNEIVRRMAMRGFLLTDLLATANHGAWLEAESFNYQLGLFYAISDGGVGDAFKADQLDKLDIRERIWNVEGKDMACPCDSNGVLITPSQDVVITTGTQDTSEDFYSPPYNPNDPRIDPSETGPLF